MQKCFSLFLFILLGMCAAGMAQQNRMTDSLELLVKTAPADTLAVGRLYLLSREFASNDSAKCWRYAHQAMQLSQDLHYPQGQALSWVAFGTAYRFEGRYDSAMYCFEQGLAIARQQHYPQATISAINGLGSLRLLQSDYEKALALFMEAVQLSEMINDKTSTHPILNNIALIYNRQENFKQAIQYFELSLKIKAEVGDKRGIASTLNNLATSYYRSKDTLKALQLHQQSLKLKQELGDKSGIAFSLYNIGELYIYLGKHQEAEKLLNESLSIRLAIKHPAGISASYRMLGVLKQLQKQFEQAIQYYHKSLKIVIELNTREEIKKTYKFLAQSYAAAGDYHSSAIYYEKYVGISEKLFTETNAREIADMQAKYETHKKEQAIELLNKEKELEQVNNRLVRNSLLGGMTLLSGLLLAAFIGYRQKQKANKQISEKNHLLELQKIELEQQQEEITAQRDSIEAKNRTLEQAYIEINQQKEEILGKNTELEQQQEEIRAQRDNIEAKNQTLEQANTEIMAQRNELEKAYDNIKVLSEIGQKVTAMLNIKSIVETVYNHVNMLMDASGFGIGIYSSKNQTITFENFIQDGEALPLHHHSLDSENDFVAWCIRHRQVIFINDSREEYRRYIGQLPQALTETGIARSMIYVPLIIESRLVGVITVQSLDKHAYEDYHLSILQTLGSYIAIALDNANAYRVIETKNTHITDSIRYAQTIQHAILPVRGKMQEAFADFFIIYQPKDVVSGDFYWFSRNEHKTFLAVIDCTGHGVPGAFMSLIGNTILNKIVSASPGISPAGILAQLHHEIRVALRQDSSSNDDGMDVCLVAIDHATTEAPARKLTFAGAKRPLYKLDQQGIITEIKGSAKSIGGRQKEGQRTFTDYELCIKDCKALYLTTDGLTDQNNRDKERFGSQRFKMLLERVAAAPMSVQQQRLLEALKEFQGDENQRDDITVIGIADL